MFDILSDKQKAIVFSTADKLIVRACPGSGKTFTVAARLANKIREWKGKSVGIACLSFTNVAWQEIGKYSSRFGIPSPVKYPHFLGTIDSFVNRFIFLPFGHLVMGCSTRPILVGEPYGKWMGRNQFDQYFEKVSYDINGQIADMRPTILPLLPRNNQNFRRQVVRIKESLVRAGYANQNDANYFALKILRDYPNITRSLVARFPVLLIDEAQDTTAIQMAIIDELVSVGLKEVLLVGDPDQAIFEWNTADPQLFQDKCGRWECLPLDECRRSSQNICNFAHNLSSLGNPALAVTPEIASHSFSPQIMEYSDGDISSLVQGFMKSCSDANIEVNRESTAILCRTRRKLGNVAKAYDGQQSTTSVPTRNLHDAWNVNFLWCKDICEGKYLIDQGVYKEGYKLIERGCYKALNQDGHFTKEALILYIRSIGFVKWRQLIHEIIISLPSTSSNVADWLSRFLPVARQFFSVSDLDGAIGNAHGTLPIQDIFVQVELLSSHVPLRLSTIHGVKGETFQAVLVAIDSKAKNTKYATILRRHQRGQMPEEEIRTLYVAITRPRKILILGVPIVDAAMWRRTFNIN